VKSFKALNLHRWYPLSPERALHYIEKTPTDELDIISGRCGSLAKERGYNEVSWVPEEGQTKGGAQWRKGR